jgi:hypothetical protein
MGVESVVEMGRTFDNEVGGTPKAVRRFAVTLTSNTLAGTDYTASELATACSVQTWGSVHPDLSFIKLRKVTINERFNDSPYHVEVVAEYGLIADNELLSPTSRAAEWSFDGKQGSLPALFYFDGSTRKALTNSAGDYIEGLTTQEALFEATCKQNYTNFPSAQAVAVNAVNHATYFGTAAHTWQLTGGTINYVTELFNNTVTSYWAASWKLLYRQTGHNLLVPDVGWNFVSGGQKRRCMVFDFENGEWVASPTPMPLNGSGQQQTGNQLPVILGSGTGLRVNPEANFTALFGTPPS